MIYKRRKIGTSKVFVTFELTTELRELRCSLVGDFNDWDSSADIFDPADDFRIVKEFEFGETHEFLYLSDTGEYFQDPKCDGVRQSNINTTNSIVVSRVIERASLPKWVKDKLTLIGELRDGILVAMGGLYIIGYLVWAINARINNLGLLPALEFQYFIAGIVPALVIILACVTLAAIRWFRRESPVWLAPSVTGWRLLLRRILFLPFFVALVGMLILPFVPTDRKEMGMIAGLIFLIASFFLPPIQDKRAAEAHAHLDKGGELVRYYWERFANLSEPLPPVIRVPLLLVQILIFLPIALIAGLVAGIRSVTLSSLLGGAQGVRLLRVVSMAWIIFVTLAFLLLSLPYFVTEVYPNIPQEFGGIRPRCAYLDVKMEQLSKETREAILPVDAIESDYKVVRSIQVGVLFSSKDFMLVRSYVEEQDDSPQTIYEIKKSDVLAVSWCD